MKQKHADEITGKAIEVFANGINQVIAWSLVLLSGLMLYAGVLGMIKQILGLK